jgi:DNA-binding MarR family transcriptional regulator
MATEQDIVNSLGFLTGRVHNQIKKRVQRYLDQAGIPLKMENYPAMRLLLQEDNLPQQAIADRIGFDRHRTSRMLDDLEQAGLLTRTSHTDNRREKLIALTELGRASSAAVQQAVSRATGDAFGSLSAGESLAIARALQIMSQNLDS